MAIALLLLTAGARAQSSTPADEQAIRQIEMRWKMSWNRHDVTAMASLFAPEADVVNLAGEWF
jgi:hypothetical protein